MGTTNFDVFGSAPRTGVKKTRRRLETGWVEPVVAVPAGALTLSQLAGAHHPATAADVGNAVRTLYQQQRTGHYPNRPEITVVAPGANPNQYVSYVLPEHLGAIAATLAAQNT
jgi:hypothetical protein